MRIDEAVPPAGTAVTGFDRLKVTPSGTLPFQLALRVIGEVNPPIEEIVIVVECEVLGAKMIGFENGVNEPIEKSAATGARTEGAPATVTVTSEVCVSTPLVAAIARV